MTQSPIDRFFERSMWYINAVSSIAQCEAHQRCYDHMDCPADEAMVSYMEEGKLPDYRDTSQSDRLVRDYSVQVGFSALNDAIEVYIESGLEGLNERVLKTLTAEMPPGLPQDGSKGQWRAANAAGRRAFEWLLGEDYCERLVETTEE